MKKILSSIIITLLLLSILPNSALAAGTNLIEDIQISLKTAENPNRLEVSFNLTEPINLSQGNSNIIIEYFTKDIYDNIETTNYIKDKLWSGYLNSYDNYPSGERKYSAGYANDNYPDNIPATRLYTSTKTSAKIDVALVAAVKITVLRADGSGEKLTIYSDGTILDIEEIGISDIEEDIPIIDQNNIGIIINPITSDLPADTIFVANELSSGPIYDEVNSILTNVKKIIAIEIKLELYGSAVQPNGKIEISIPIPENINSTNLVVYRIENNTLIPYPVKTTTNEGIKYATFETDHFSIYVLAESIGQTPNRVLQGEANANNNEVKTEEKMQESTKEETTEEINENKIPTTGIPQTFKYNVAIGINFALAILLLIPNKKENKTK